MHLLTTAADIIAAVPTAGGFGTKGVQDFLKGSVIQLILLIIVCSVLMKSISGNNKLIMKIGGGVGAALLIYGLATTPGALSTIVTGLAGFLSQG